MSEFETPTARVLVADDEPHLLRRSSSGWSAKGTRC